MAWALRNGSLGLVFLDHRSCARAGDWRSGSSLPPVLYNTTRSYIQGSRSTSMLRFDCIYECIRRPWSTAFGESGRDHHLLSPIVELYTL